MEQPKRFLLTLDPDTEAKIIKVKRTDEYILKPTSELLRDLVIAGLHALRKEAN